MKPRWKEIGTCAVAVCVLLWLSYLSVAHGARWTPPHMFWMAISYVLDFLAGGCLLALWDVHRHGGDHG